MLSNMKFLKPDIQISFPEAYVKLINCVELIINTLTTYDRILQTIEEFVCKIYSLKTKYDIYKRRYEIFVISTNTEMKTNPYFKKYHWLRSINFAIGKAKY